MNARKLLPLTGVLAVVLIVVGFAVAGESPETDDPASEIVSYYTDNEADAIWASVLSAWGALAFLAFSAYLSDLFGRWRPAGGVAPRVVLAGGILFAVGGTLFAGINFTAAEAADDLDPSALQTLNALNMNMFIPLAVGASAFMLAAGAATLKTDLLPGWLGWVAIVIGIAAVTPAGFFAFLALGLWTLVVSAMLAMRDSAVEDHAGGDAVG